MQWELCFSFVQTYLRSEIELNLYNNYSLELRSQKLFSQRNLLFIKQTIIFLLYPAMELSIRGSEQ